jgi:hypothetical protein
VQRDPRLGRPHRRPAIRAPPTRAARRACCRRHAVRRRSRPGGRPARAAPAGLRTRSTAWPLAMAEKSSRSRPGWRTRPPPRSSSTRAKPPGVTCRGDRCTSGSVSRGPGGPKPHRSTSAPAPGSKHRRCRPRPAARRPAPRGIRKAGCASCPRRRG